MNASKFTTNEGIFNFNTIRRTHWNLYKNQIFVDSHASPLPKILTEYNIKRNGKRVLLEYKVQSSDSYSAVFCSYFICF